MPGDDKQYLRFEVGAGVILTLGRDLITDYVQAVIELVKNAYDADSSWVKVEIDTSAVSDDEHCLGATGFVRVSDGGHGMMLEDVQRGWLTLAHSRKRKMKKEGRLTKKRHRTPLGDKGLGRLGSQALGRYVEIVTRPEGSDEELVVWIDWAAFGEDFVLSEVDVEVVSSPRASDANDGTIITVYGLHALDTWSTSESKKDLQNQLARLISPFHGVHGFWIDVSIDGASLDLLELGAEIRRSAATTFSFSFDGSLLEMEGKARLAYCCPSPNGRKAKKDVKSKFKTYVSSDGGEQLMQRLVKRAAAKRNSELEIEASDDESWFVVGRSSRVLGDLDKIELEKGEPVSPGPFSGELDTFVFSGSDLSVSSNLKAIVQGFSGIRVYRDGFGIKLHDDWLGLAKHITSGGSYFELKLDNTIGYIAITAADNSQLVETADRQRFQEDVPAFKNFRLLMGEVVRFVGEFQELLRRETSKFLKEESKKDVGVDPEEPTKTVGGRFDTFVYDARAAKQQAAKQKGKLQEVRERIDSHTNSPQTNLLSPVGIDFEDLLRDVDQVLEQTQKTLDDLDVVLSQADVVIELRNLLVERNETLREQAVLLHETAGLGIAAEMVSHEIAQISDGLLARATPLVRELRNKNADSKTIGFVEHVRGQAVALRRQAGHVAPSLRYVRERRSYLNVEEIVADVADYHQARLARGNISMQVSSVNSVGFSVYMNQGKLTQVLDNLIINAEYWVAERIRYGVVSDGDISITIERPFVRVTDSGNGVDPAVEEMVFEQPFVTRKKGGRGLGLFISRQLLESDGCTIMLAPERNDKGRLTTFEIDLSGVIREPN